MRGVKVTAMAPATIANLGPGFDIFGLALTQPSDTVSLTCSNTGEITLESDIGTNVAGNSAGVAVLRLLEKYSLPGVGIHITVTKGMEIGTGMGSSAASCAAAAKAFSELFRLNTGREVHLADLLEACVHAEAVCAGSRHGDNCIPAMVGGFAIITSVESTPQYMRLEVPTAMQIIVVKPNISVLTRAARAILPTSVSLKSRMSVAAHCASMSAALLQGDVASFCRHIVLTDVEEARSTLIPYYQEARNAAVAAGALAFSIAGSGPSVFAITTEDRKNAEEIADQIAEAFQKNCKVFHCRPNNSGAVITHSEVYY